MARLSTQLAALEKWLSSAKDLQSPESYQKLREQQFTSLQNHLQEQRLSMEEAAVAMQDLASSRHWKDCQKAALAGILSASVTSMEKITLSLGSRVQLQDYGAFLKYLPATMWDLLMNPDVDQCRKVSVVASHLVSLGLKSPTEGTSQAVACLFLQLPGANQYGTYQLRHQLYLSVKEFLRRSTQAAGPLEGKPFVTRLPTEPAEMPAAWTLNKSFAPPRVDTLLHYSLLPTVPMRTSSRHLKDDKRDVIQMLFAKLRAAMPHEQPSSCQA